MGTSTLFLFFVVAFCGVAHIHGGEITADLYNTNVTIKWHTDYEKQTVDFSIWFGVQTPDILFLGFLDFGEMNNTDALIYSHRARDEKIQDSYTNRNHQIMEDIQQDWQLIRKRVDHIVVRRKLTTCDSRDYAFQPGTTQFIIAGVWGYKEIGDIRDKRCMCKKFGKVFEGSADEPNIVGAPVKLEEDMKRVIVNTNSPDPVPNQETTYQCIIKKIPFDTVKRTYHIVRMEPYITSGNEHLVHHMVVFICRDSVEEWRGNCNSPQKPKEAKSCSHVIAGWSMGEGPIIYPQEAGLPFGGNGRDEYVMVEIHYNNPDLLAGVMDMSGFQFYVTEKLRKYDAGIMELGVIHSDVNSIPPNQKAWAMNGYCTPECSQNLPEDGINIFASQLHAHLTGRKLFTSQYRSGVKIGEINRDEHYSPHWQHLQQLRPVVKVMPGDTLVTTCVYDTRKRSNVTLGGFSIAEEMCDVFIYYYPTSNLEVCKSTISNTTLRSYFAQRHGMNKKAMTISEMYNGVKDWGNGVDEEFYNVLNVGNLNVNCLKSDGQPFEFMSNDPSETWENRPRPRFVSGSFIKTRDRYQCPAINDMVNFE